MKRKTLPVTAGAGYVAVLVTLSSAALAAEGVNMIGRQSQNEGMWVVPTPGEVTIDGDLSDWDWSGRIWCFADIGIRDEYSVEAAAMWDKQNLYLAGKWKDPHPMNSKIHYKFESYNAWQSDCLDLGLRTDTMLHMMAYYYEPGEMPAINVMRCRGRDDAGMKSARVTFGKDGRLRSGVELRFRKDGDGKGYAQEVKLPWKFVYDEQPDVKPGMTFQLSVELCWGDPSGDCWQMHQYVDNLQPGRTERHYMWDKYESWGDAVLLGRGKVPVRRYTPGVIGPDGLVRVRATIPEKATRFTMAIDDEDGNRVRNLAGDFDPEECTLEVTGDDRVVEVLWDCLDDEGKLVPPGTYRVRGLAHEGLGAIYDMSFYNPGTPPWRTRKNSEGWGADQRSPCAIEAYGDMAFVAYEHFDVGSGIIGIGPDGRKKWGIREKANFLAVDDGYLYSIMWGKYWRGSLERFNKADGSRLRFATAEGKKIWKPTWKLVGRDTQITDMAAHKGTVVIASKGGKLFVINSNILELEKTIAVPSPSAVASDTEGRLYVIADCRINRVDLETGERREITSANFGPTSGLAIDADGNILVMDLGSDCQIKAFSPEGELVYTAGRKGGRPIRGAFDEEGLRQWTYLAADGRGQIWAAEHCDFPRRVSVWGRNGKLIRQYLGCTGYACTGCYLHDQDPTLAYVGPMEFKLDRADHTWELRNILWVPDDTKGERFMIDPNKHEHAQRFTADTGFGPHEYLYSHQDQTHVVFTKREGGWQPVAAIGPVIAFSGKLDRKNKIVEAPSGGFDGLDPQCGVFWNDLNGNGIPERNECELADEKLALYNGWGGRISKDLAIYACGGQAGMAAYKPVRISKDGAPVYGAAGMRKLGLKKRGDLVYVSEDDLLLCLDEKSMLGIDEPTGRILWTYPNRYNMHASHRAPMPRPGLLIGSMKICGVAEVSDPIGNVFLIRGNAGQDFFMTTDGLFVGALFPDFRYPLPPLPETEEELRGKPLTPYTNGDEPFNGWFGKQSDGQIRMVRGFEQNMVGVIAEVTGLDTIRRFRGPDIELDAVTLVEADQQRIAREAARKDKKSYIVKRLKHAPAIDGKPEEWHELLAMRIRKWDWPEDAHAKLAYDSDSLYVMFDVADASPWRNAGTDYARMFKTGDALDLQLSTLRSEEEKRAEVRAGDVRILLCPLNGEPTGVLMRPVDPDAPPDAKRRYESDAGARTLDRVQVLEAAAVAAAVDGDHYFVEAAVPLAAIGLEPAPGIVIRGDLGLISSDPQGLRSIVRAYWANEDTPALDDAAAEAWLYPGEWGRFMFE